MQTPHLTRKQTEFFVAQILGAAVDRCSTVEFDNEEQKMQYFCGVMDTAGLALAGLYASLTSDGMAIQDAIELARFSPDTTHEQVNGCAVLFVDNCFASYEFVK